jgi:TldD protein
MKLSNTLPLCATALMLGALLSTAGVTAAPEADISGEVSRDAVLRAMADEVAREKTLRLNNLDRPYEITYASDDPEEVTMAASLGGLLYSRRDHVRRVVIRVRVGDAKFDNSDSVYTRKPGNAVLPLDDNYHVVRDQLWLNTDRVYKNALMDIERKRTALREISDPDKTPDFAPANPVQVVQPFPTLKMDQKHWEQLIQSLSAQFAAYPEINSSNVRLRAISSTFRLVDTDGTIERVPEELAEVGIGARALAPDGTQVWDDRFFTTLHPSELPNEHDLKKAVDAIATETAALAKAPMAEEYSGPVLFEHEAAGQLMAELLADASRVERRPMVPPEYANRLRILDSVWETRQGAKVTPDWLTIVDDPAQTRAEGVVLAGQYDVDEEGVPAKRVMLVQNGTLKDFLTTRQPTHDGQVSNGHARLPGDFGAELATFGNLFVQATGGVSDAQLKAKLLENVKSSNLKYGILIRRLDFPATAGADELRNMLSQLQKEGVTRTVTAPLLAYRVYPDGHEELVRGLRFKEFSAKDLRDLEAASDHPYVFNYINNGSAFNFADTGAGATTSSVICPSLLFYTVDLDRAREETGKPPDVPPPSLVAASE